VRTSLFSLTGLAVLFACGADTAGAATTSAGILVNARIHALDAAHPMAEALAWDAAGRIVAVGTREAVLAKAAAGARTHDARGATVVPGLIDAHAHLMGLGLALMSADLVGARSRAEVIARLLEFEKRLPPGAWLLGRGWDQNDWLDKSFPTAAELLAASVGESLGEVQSPGAEEPVVAHLSMLNLQPDNGRALLLALTMPRSVIVGEVNAARQKSATLILPFLLVGSALVVWMVRLFIAPLERVTREMSRFAPGARRQRLVAQGFEFSFQRVDSLYLRLQRADEPVIG